VLEEFWKHADRNKHEPLMLRGGKVYSGMNLVPLANHVKELVDLTGARRLLQYGSGLGYQYRRAQVHRSWKMADPPYMFEPNVLRYSHRPNRKFDGLIIVDVLEHVPEEHVQTVLADAMSFLDTACESFAFIAVKVTLARESLENEKGDAHLTARLPGWWAELITQYRRPGLRLRSVYT
jgi:hypothetical protein